MATTPVDVEGLDDPERLARLAVPVVAGDTTAPITITEFADFQCPACRGFHTSVKPQVDATFIESGVAQFNFYDFPLTALHAHAFLAARAARCAEAQGQFWLYHDMLFANQDQWAYSTSPVGLFEDFAGEIGLDVEAFGSCVRGDRYAELVTAEMEFARQLQVASTPTVIVFGEGPNGAAVRRAEGNDFASVERAVEAVRAETGLADPAEQGEEGDPTSGDEA